MTPHIVTAGVEPLLFYLAIVAIWTVLKKVSEKSKQQRSETTQEQEVDPEAPAQAPPADMEEGLRKFIETVTGQKLPQAEEADAEPPSPPPPVILRRKPMVRPERTPEQVAPPQVNRRRERIPTPPAESPKPARGRAAPKPTRGRTTPTPALAPKHYDIVHSPGTQDITASEISDAIQDELTALGELSKLTRLPSMNLAMPSMKLPRSSDESRRRFRIPLKDRKAVRKAIVQRVVLGPPRAMGSDMDENQLSL